MKNGLTLLAAIGMGLVCSNFAKADIVWDVTATLTDGRLGTDTISGSFTVNSALDFVTWDITVSGPDMNSYVKGDGSTADLSDGNREIVFEDSLLGPGVGLFLASALPPSGGSTINLLAGSFSDSTNVCSPLCLNGGDTFVSGSIKEATTPAPEPVSVAWSVPAILGVLLLFRRRQVSAN